MTKADLADKLYEKIGLPKKEATSICSGHLLSGCGAIAGVQCKQIPIPFTSASHFQLRRHVELFEFINSDLRRSECVIHGKRRFWPLA